MAAVASDGSPGEPVADLSSPLARLVEQVWPTEDTAVAVTTAGPPPPGFRVVERYRVVPTTRRARFVLPAGSRDAASAAVLSYNALRPARTRLARWATGQAIRAGAGALADGLTVVVRADVDDRDLAAHLITAHVAAAIGADDLYVAVGVRPPTPNSKPTLQAFTAEGDAAAFAKVGWNDVTRDLVTSEAEALRAVSAALRTIETPRLMWSGRWRERALVVTAPLPIPLQRWPDPARCPDPATIDEIAMTGAVESLDVTALVGRHRSRLTGAGWSPDLEAATDRCLDALDRHLGDVRLRTGRWHGDWVPWNVALAGGRLVVWDWENSATGAPVGADAIHWHLQVAQVLRGLDAHAALEQARTRSAAAIRELQPDPRAVDAVFGLYLIELTIRTETMRLRGAGVSQRFLPEAGAALDRLAARLAAAP